MAVHGRALPVVAAVSAVLGLAYAGTIAPDVTFWDAGEFVAAAADLGIPHPPGTPLYVLLLRVTLLALGGLGVAPAVATALVSAVGTIAACALGAAMLARATGQRMAAAAGGVAAGTMATVWLNATETEVYAASLALSVAIVWAAERAGRQHGASWTALTVYLVALAVPLHLSALLAAPAAVLLAAHGDATLRWSTVRWGRGGVVAASALFAAAVGRASPLLCVVAMTAIAAATWQLGREMHGAGEAPPPVWRRASVVVAVTAVACLATSALAILLIRARHDPWVNQGNPSTVAALVEVVARRQYAVAGLWPRQAPLWLQLGNVGLYADWQVALSLGPSIFPTPLRTAATVAFGLLGVVGSVGHRRDDRRSWRAIMLLFLAGSIGVALYLNLKAGPSYGHGILPEGAPREARERDYFFVLAWWAWGLWAGYGAVRLARSRGLPGAAGALVAALPLVLNWRAVDRGRLPEATLPRMTAEGLLRHVPRNAVLFVAGDNDTYPLWYAQRALGLRRDVVVITTPLLPAQWYRDELATRHGLTVRAASWRGRQATIAEIADSARGRGRPVAMSMAMPAVDRAVLGARWALGGPAFVRVEGGNAPPLGVDTNVARWWSSELARRTGGGDPSPATDGTARYMTQLLRCPARALRDARSGGSAVPSDSLAPLCNFR